jgi:hypothetical protein
MKVLTGVLATLGISGLIVAAQQAPPSGPGGTWEVEGQPLWTIALEVNGDVLTGTVVQGRLEHEIFDGSVAGDTVTFKARSADGDRIVSFTGRFDGDVIQFTRDVTILDGGVAGGNALMGGNGPSEFTVRRSNPDRWMGEIRNAPTQRNPTPNPNPRQVTVTTRQVPDPHWRWRGGEKEITVRRFGFNNNSFELDAFELADDRLAYSYSRPGPGDEVRCELTRQPGGDFAGMCRAGAGNFTVFITLTPPPTLNRD